MHLYEAHLPVASTEAAGQFYINVVGLPFAYRDPSRDIVFLWATSKEHGMIGLWGRDTVRGPGSDTSKHHVAFALSLHELFEANDRLKKRGIETLGFDGNRTTEPGVIGWM